MQTGVSGASIGNAFSSEEEIRFLSKMRKIYLRDIEFGRDDAQEEVIDERRESNLLVVHLSVCLALQTILDLSP